MVPLQGQNSLQPGKLVKEDPSPHSSFIGHMHFQGAHPAFSNTKTIHDKSMRMFQAEKDAHRSLARDAWRVWSCCGRAVLHALTVAPTQRTDIVYFKVADCVCATFIARCYLLHLQYRVSTCTGLQQSIV
jgi:hypothetical protein